MRPNHDGDGVTGPAQPCLEPANDATRDQPASGHPPY